jgi:hypothetical protein
MEQIWPAIKATEGAPAQPLLFLLPAEAEPIVQPYMQYPGVAHLAGSQGALAYQTLRGGDTAGSLAAAAGQQRFAVLAFVALLLAGAVVVGVSLVAGRRRSASS